MPGEQDNQTLYIQSITQHQRVLYAYIRSLVGNGTDTDDILQETNLALWKQFPRFTPGTNFAAYAMRVARNKVTDHARSGKKLGGLVYDTELAERIAERMVPEAGQVAEKIRALEGCIAKLPDDARSLLKRRYGNKESVRTIASEASVSESSLQNHFYKLRDLLRICVEKTMREAGA